MIQFSDVSNTDMFKLFASVVTGGAFVGWLRERRQARRDTQLFSIEFMREQSSALAKERARVDELIREVAALKVEHREIRAEYRATIVAKDVEIARLNAELHRFTMSAPTGMSATMIMETTKEESHDPQTQG